MPAKPLTALLSIVPLVLASTQGCQSTSSEPPRTGAHPPQDEGAGALSFTAQERGDGRTTLTVENRGPEPVRLAFGAEIEAVEIPAVAGDPETPASEYSIGPRWFFLTQDCAGELPHGAPTDRCVTLAPGQTLRVAPWTGYNATVQCPRGRTPSDFPSPPGTYRFVLTACDGSRTYRSAPFRHSSRAAERSGDY